MVGVWFKDPLDPRRIHLAEVPGGESSVQHLNGLVLYKAMRRDIAESMIERGMFRLGTLEEYRTRYESSPAIHDPYDAKQTLYIDYPEGGLGLDDSVRNLLKEHMGIVDSRNMEFATDRPQFVVVNMPIQFDVHHVEGFAFCASCTMSRARFERFRAEVDEGYNCVVRVRDARRLLEIIIARAASTLFGTKDLDAIWARRVLYRPTHLDATTASYDNCTAVSKDPKFEWQDEFRFLLQTKSKYPPLEPVAMPDIDFFRATFEIIDPETLPAE